MKPKTIAGLVLMVGFATLLFFNFGAQVGGYMDFTEAEATGTNAHVVGKWVEEQHFSYDRDQNVFSFHMVDGEGQVRQVRYANPKPPNFEDADQLVVEGYAEGETFVANHILVKCPSKYNDARGLEQAEAAS